MVSFYDLEQTGNPMNGEQFHTAADIANLFDRLIGRTPFVFELRNEDRSMLTVGIARDHGFVQYGACDGSPPYWVALANEPAVEDDFTEFLAGGTPTPIHQRFQLPIESVRTIANDYLERGLKSTTVSWEQI